LKTPIKGMKLNILKRITDGHAGVVMQVRDLSKKNGGLYALKVPKKPTVKHLYKLHEEAPRNVRLKEFGLCYAKIVEEGADYLVKKWVEGTRGDVWFREWNQRGRPMDDKPFLALIGIFDDLSQKGVYVQNLKDLNMIYDGKKWVVIDVGYFKTNMVPREALGRFYDTFDSRWNKNSTKQFECPGMMEIRGQTEEDVSMDAAIKADQRRLKLEKAKQAAAEMMQDQNGNENENAQKSSSVVVEKKKKKKKKSIKK